MNERLTDFDRHVLLARTANRFDDMVRDELTMPTYSADDRTEHSCGSAGCFAGWVATWYSSHGWKFGLFGRPFLGEDFGPEAIASFFAIPKEYAQALVYGWSADGIGKVSLYDCPPRVLSERIRTILRIVDPAALAAANTDSIPEVSHV